MGFVEPKSHSEFWYGCPIRCRSSDVLAKASLQVEGHPPYNRQVNAHRMERGVPLPISREKAVKQIAKLVDAFIKEVGTAMQTHADHSLVTPRFTGKRSHSHVAVHLWT